MRSISLITFATILSCVLVFNLLSPHQTGLVEAGKKKLLQQAILAALLLHGGKKILFPLPIPLPIPILKQTQPIYYQQQSYQGYEGGYGGGYGGY